MRVVTRLDTCFISQKTSIAPQSMVMCGRLKEELILLIVTNPKLNLDREWKLLVYTKGQPIKML